MTTMEVTRCTICGAPLAADDHVLGCPTQRYTAPDFPGVALRLLGSTTHVERTSDGDEYEDVVRVGWVDVVMVGDDRVHSVEASELVLLDEGTYCAECGQVGCFHDGRER